MRIATGNLKSHWTKFIYIGTLLSRLVPKYFWRDSNSHFLDPKSNASTNWATEAELWLVANLSAAIAANLYSVVCQRRFTAYLQSRLILTRTPYYSSYRSPEIRVWIMTLAREHNIPSGSNRT